MKHCVDFASLYGMIGTKTFWSKVEIYAGRSSYDIAMILHSLEVQCCRSIPCYREHSKFWIWIELMVHDDHLLQMLGVLLKSYPPPITFGQSNAKNSPEIPKTRTEKWPG